MEAIYNIYFEREKTSGRIQVAAPNNSLFVPLYGNSHGCSSVFIPQSPEEPGGCFSDREDVLSWTWPHSPEHPPCFLRFIAQGLLAPFSAVHLGLLPFSFPWNPRPGESSLSALARWGSLSFQSQGRKTWREHWVQALPFRNEDTEVQGSERTWQCGRGNLWQNGDFDPNCGSTFSMEIQMSDECVQYGHLSNSLLIYDYLSLLVFIKRCWIAFTQYLLSRLVETMSWVT